MNRVYNFSPGPATLPLEVLEEVQKEFTNYKNTGMSIIEMSHRGKIFEEVHFESMNLLRKIANIPDRFDILYMTGGASTQFALIPLNLTGNRFNQKSGKAGYILTGEWAKKAYEQAKIQNVNIVVVASSEDKNFSYIPKNYEIPEGLDYLHITSNNTIYGTQFHELPKPKDTKLVIDMSSDFLSRPIDWTHIGLVYAGLQKNAGPSGMTVVVIDKEYYQREYEYLPTMFRYSTFGKNQSLYNTPPTFQIYMFNLVLKWIEKKGGLEELDKINRKKAKYIYDAIDESEGFYYGHSVKEDRSLMNVTFRLKNESLMDEFLNEAKKHNLYELKGHRSVGGLRASIYNAMPEEGCKILAEFMRDFHRRKG
ncbi:MAG: 3-phosphoserine/phosphohydroxythreonine transaminase [Leptospiraceae bacterium]|nr:3-phosphoserine/phosphohydroxythreonine transaminase [Leptospiraceae bacterium]MDW7976359.1 3-phosphoserine/phosphohydroxythreonine transaminase [Leptospiraceae bacterium]